MIITTASITFSKKSFIIRVARLLALTSVLIGVPFTVAAQVQSPPPAFDKNFNPSTIGPGSVSTLIFTIDNLNSAAPATDLAFTDFLPAGVAIADPASASTSCTEGMAATLSAADGGSTISLSDYSVGAFSVCTVNVDVTSSTVGVHMNVSGDLTSIWGNSGTASSDLTVDSTLIGFSKSFAPSSVALGGRSILTFTIDNSLNPALSKSMQFIDNLPTGMQIAGPANASTNCNNSATPILAAITGTGVVSLDGGGVAGASTCTVTVDVVATGVGMLDNVSDELISAFGVSSTLFSNGKASATLEVTGTAIALRKSFINDPVAPGGTVTLDFTLNNFDRNFSATGVAFTDDLTTLSPALAGLTYAGLLSNDCGGSVSGVGGTTITFSGGTLAAESSCTISVSLAVPVAATPAIHTNITSTITGTIDGASVVGNMATDDLFVEPVPILSKEFLQVGTLLADPVINAGDDVVLRFTITNPSTTSGATNIAFLDELTDGGLFTGFLPFPVTVSLLPVPDPPCGAGSSLDPAASFGDEREGLSLTGGSLAAAPGPGDSCTFEVIVTVPVGVGPGVKVNTTGAPTATIDGATRIGASASDTLTVIAAPSLSKSFTDDPVAPGTTVNLEFTLNYPDDASGDATAITFTDNLANLTPALAGLIANLPPTPDPPCGAGSSLTGSAGDTFLTLAGGSLMPGGSCTFGVTLDVPAGTAPGAYTNATSAVSATVEGLATSSAAASDDVNVTGLVFSKEFVGDPVVAGDSVTLRFTIENIHPTDDATAIGFIDNLADVLPGTPDLIATLPPSVNTCGGSMSGTSLLIYSGGSVTQGDPPCTIDIEVTVPAGAPDGDYANTTGDLSAMQGGTVTIDPATDVLTVNSALLQLSKVFTDDPVAPGDTVTLEFNLTNLDAGQAATAVAFSDNFDATVTGLTFDSVLLDTCAGTTTGTGSSEITVSGVSLAAGGSCTIRVSLTVPAVTAAGIYPNTSSAVTGMVGGLAVTGFSATDDLQVLQLLLFSKSFDGPTTATGSATLTFTITNPGIDTASGIAFSDNLNDVIPGLVATSLPSAPCGLSSSITGISLLTFTGGELPPSGGMCSFDVEVQAPVSAAAGTYPNTTSDLSSNGLKVSDPATALLTIEPAPTFAKAFVPDLITVGAVSKLTFTIDNTASTLAASALDFTDNLPAGVVVASPSNKIKSCTGGMVDASSGSGLISYSGGSVAAAASCTISVDVIGTTNGSFVNTTGDLTSSSGNSGTAAAVLTVNPLPPLFSKSFTPDLIAITGTSQLRLTINNAAGPLATSGLSFSDNLPSGLFLATPANATSDCSGGTLTAVAGTSVITYTGGTVGSGTSCSVSVDTTSSVAGTYINTTGNLISIFGNSGSASAMLNVDDDLDDDTVPNATDNCPNDANTDQADLDRDGIGDVCDLDADGDLMPNDWEIANGLDPFDSFDQQADNDGDGFTNLQEYEFGTDPNSPNQDENNNGVPDIVDKRRMIIVPNIIFPLLLDEMTP